MHHHVCFKARQSLKLSIAHGATRRPLRVQNLVYFQVVLDVVACRTLIASVLLCVTVFHHVLAELLHFVEGGAAFWAFEGYRGVFWGIWPAVLLRFSYYIPDSVAQLGFALDSFWWGYLGLWGDRCLWWGQNLQTLDLEGGFLLILQLTWLRTCTRPSGSVFNTRFCMFMEFKVLVSELAWMVLIGIAT